MEESKKEYIGRINRVMDYVEQHINEDINLNTIAQIAHFSPYHFHRIFTVMTGETPANFILRVRLEKAAHLIQDESSKMISEIAFDCGFSSTSLFSRSFRKYFGISAKELREREKAILVNNGIRYSKNGQVVSKISKDKTSTELQLCSVELKKLIFMETKIEIKEMPEMQVVYCRHTGAFHEIYKAYDKLMQWAGPRGLLNFPKTKSLTVYHDDPAITSIDKVRQSACITVESDIKTDGEIGKMTVDGGKYAVGRFEIGVMEFEKAWNTMCNWLIESGYQPADANTYELYHNNHEEHPEKKFILDICIPVRTL